MNLSQIRRYRRRNRTLPRMVANNPLLIMGLDFPFVVVGATGLKNAVAFSVEMLFIHLFTMIVAYLIAPKLKIWQRVFATTIVSTVVMVFSRELVLMLIPDIENYAGMYLYLMALNGVTLFQANFLSKEAKLPKVMVSAMLNIVVFALTMTVVSVIREYLGTGTLWGIPVPSFARMEGVRAPFFGFILMGMLIALGRFINRKLTGFAIIDNMRRESTAAAEQPQG